MEARPRDKRKRLPLHELPQWPRLMSVSAAAAYVGLHENTFLQRVGEVRPPPIRFGRLKFYDRRAIDAAVDALSAEAAAPKTEATAAPDESGTSKG